MNSGVTVPTNVAFKTRVGDDAPEDGGCPIGGIWKDVTTRDIFSNKRVAVFSLPGAFTPTCSTYQVPGFEESYDEIKSLGVDEVYVVSVNDSFVMNAWIDFMNIKNIKPIPDGSGEFTRQMGMLVDKDNLGFGMRSWRYAMIVNDGIVEAWFEEPGRTDNASDDPYGETSPESVIDYLKG
jgi:peroxiredoxin